MRMLFFGIASSKRKYVIFHQLVWESMPRPARLLFLTGKTLRKTTEANIWKKQLLEELENVTS